MSVGMIGPWGGLGISGSIGATIIIPLCAIVGITSAVRLLTVAVRLDRERRALGRLSRAWTEESADRMSRSENSVEQKRLRDGIKETAGSEVERRARNALNWATHDPGAALVRTIHGASQMPAPTGTTRFLAGLPVLLGLLGTLIGLSTAVSGLQLVATDIRTIEDFQVLIDPLLGTLAGMETAFETSCFGLLVSLPLLLVVSLVSRWSARLDEQLDELVVDRIISPHQDSAPEDKVLAAAEKMNGVVKTLGSVSTSIKEVAQESRDAGARMKEAAVDAAKGMSCFRADMEKIYQREIMAQQLMEKRDEEASAVLRGLEASSRAIQQALGDISNQRADDAQRTEDLLERIRDVLVSTLAALESAQGSASRAQRAHVDALNQANTHLKESLRSEAAAAHRAQRELVQIIVERLEATVRETLTINREPFVEVIKAARSLSAARE